MKYSLPKKNKEFILTPSMDEMKPLVESNHKLLDKIPFLDLRTQLRRAVFKELDEKPIVACGHQPVIYHPGILFKDMVVNALIERYGFSGLNLVVDSDTLNNNRYIPLPFFRDGRLNCEEIQLFQSERNLAFEEISPPDRQKFNQTLNYISKNCKDWVDRESLEIYRKATDKAYPVSRNLAQFNTFSKRAFEERLGFKHTEVFLSSLCQSKAFIYFFSLILFSCRQFVTGYNKILEIKLKQSDDIVELPFWLWKEGEERTTLYIKFNKGSTWICGGDREILDIDISKIDPLIETIDNLKSSYKIRPKALMLTLFARLFLCDLWIHGIGGAKYEELNDRLAQEFFSITLPEYAVASATLYLNFNLPDITDEEIKDLKNTLRKMKFNPENFLRGQSPLIKTKEELIKKMKQAKYKKELHNQLMVTNEKLRNKITSQIQDLEKTILEKERLKKIIINREFPFFIFPLNDLKSMSEKLIF